jgi:alanine dehydrogenase
LNLADRGYPRALLENEHLCRGLNVAQGRIACQAVAESHGLSFTAPEQILAA